jgi:hypothetical protein
MRRLWTQQGGTTGLGLGVSESLCRSLMARYQAGDLAAFEMLRTRLAPGLSAHLSARSADGRCDPDRLDAVFVTLHRARRTYNPSQAFEPWLADIVRLAGVRCDSDDRQGLREPGAGRGRPGR